MKVYVITVKSIKTGRVNVSWEGYSTLEAAQAFIEGRSDKPKTDAGWCYYSDICEYRIHEINIK